MRPTLDGVCFNRLSQDQVEVLSQAFSLDELEKAVDSCDGNKCPWPDGFNFNFIKAFWELIK